MVRDPFSLSALAGSTTVAEENGAVPRHVAVIMDGNGRWAMQHGLPRLGGHRAGTENIRRVVEAFAEAGVECLTLYTFSTENWRRPQHEVEGLMGLLQEVILRETEALHKRNVRLRHLGRLDRLPPELQGAIRSSMELTSQNTGIVLGVAFDYGGRRELVDAIRQLIRDRTDPEAVNEDLVDRYLYTSELPDPDLVIRTAGEMRLSNFMLWQAAYAEYYTTATLWPDFDVVEVGRALEAYSQRRRRFGALNPEE